MIQLIEVRDLSNSVVKSIKPPVQTNEIFYGGTASLILSSTTAVVLYGIQQRKTLVEVNKSPYFSVIHLACDSRFFLSRRQRLSPLSTQISRHNAQFKHRESPSSPPGHGLLPQKFNTRLPLAIAKPNGLPPPS